MKKIAVTGPLSSGKSTVCQILAEISSCCIVDADQLVNQLYQEAEIKEKIAEIYNKKINPKNPITPLEVNKKLIADSIFDHPNELLELEKILHPLVKRKIEENCQKASGKCDFCVVEIPLLYEVGWEKEFDVVILVDAEEKACQMRFMKKTGKSQQEYQKRSMRFLETREKAKMTPYVVDNNDSINSIKKQLQTIIAKIQGD